LLALRTSGNGKTLTFLTQYSTVHASLIHLVCRVNPYELPSPQPQVVNLAAAAAVPAKMADYAMADAQLHLLVAIVSANSVFLVPTITALWKSLSYQREDAPVERYGLPRAYCHGFCFLSLLTLSPFLEPAACTPPWPPSSGWSPRPGRRSFRSCWYRLPIGRDPVAKLSGIFGRLCKSWSIYPAFRIVSLN
jgi:hypothetical protein